jgi:hypothetical protein
MDPDEIRKQLSAHGRKRTRAMATQTAESAAIAALAAVALQAGLTKSEVARLAQISRPALDAMLKH